MIQIESNYLEAINFTICMIAFVLGLHFLGLIGALLLSIVTLVSNISITIILEIRHKINIIEVEEGQRGPSFTC